MKKLFTFVWFLIFAGISFGQPICTGHWNFNLGGNLLKADIGQDLEFSGKTPGIAEGPDYFDGAALVRRGSYLIANTNIQPKSGESLINNYSLALDIKLPRTDQPYTLLQTDTTNLSDADIFIRESGKIGSDSIGYVQPGLIESNEWYRVVITVQTGMETDIYLDGKLVLKGKAVSKDGVLSLGKKFLLFADDSNEDNLIIVSDCRIFSGVLSAEEIKALGGFDHSVAPVLVNTYLQSPTPNSIYICWQTSAAGSYLTYGKTRTMGTKVIPENKSLDTNVVWNWVKLTNLEPNTEYYYQVNDCRTEENAAQSEIKKFRTLPEANISQGHFRFAVYSDSHGNAPMHTVVAKEMRKKFIELYGENFQDSIRLVMHVGDIANGDGLQNYRIDYLNCIKGLSGNIPYMVTIGNHEGESNYYYDYMKYEDFAGPELEKYYSFRACRSLFVVLNSNIKGDAQVKWLDDQLSKAENDDQVDWVFVFAHHFYHSEVWSDSTEWTGKYVIPVINKYKKADILFNGHAHHYSRGAVHEGNLRLLIAGGGGSTLDRWAMYRDVVDYPEIQKSIDHYNYMIFDVDLSNKRYDAKVFSLGHTDVKLNNVIIDQFYRDKSDKTQPEKPLQVTPVKGETINSPVILAAGKFIGTGELMSSEFQIVRSGGSFNSPLVKCERVNEDIFKNTGVPDFQLIDLNKGIDLTKYSVDASKLIQGAEYQWRVRYRNKNLQWSDWSDPGKFIAGQLSSLEDKQTAAPKEYKLFDNYPNPFNPSTIIKFDLPHSSVVTLKLYDVLGREVETLFSGNLASGSHKVSFNSSGINSGIYFYLLEAKGDSENRGGFRAVKKMVVVK